MPYGYSGQCYSTTGEALERFQKGFPILGESNWQSHVSSSVNSGGLITYTVSIKSLSGLMGVSSVSGTMQLATCGTVDAPVFDPVAAGGVFAFFFLGVAGVWYLSQNLGLILEAVKKW